MTQIVVRIPKRLKTMIKKYIDLDAHKDVSEFVRDALREKIKRDAPALYESLFTAEEVTDEGS
jgi:Arc/MetJ-type ribon-helix-helix transcriptional regulator